MRKLGALAGAAIITLTAGCTTGEASPPPAKVTPATTSPAPRPEPSPSPTATPSPVADPAIMAAMTCQPLDKDLLATLQFGPTPTSSIQVEAGEGLEPGSQWWVVILNLPDDEYHGWPPRTLHFLTDAPAQGEAGMWITLPQKSNPWANVTWGPERLTQAQSALTKAQECLGA